MRRIRERKDLNNARCCAVPDPVCAVSRGGEVLPQPLHEDIHRKPTVGATAHATHDYWAPGAESFGAFVVRP